MSTHPDLQPSNADAPGGQSAEPPRSPFHDIPSAPSGGLLHHLWGWAGATLQFIQLRSQLALSEARDAGAHFGKLAGLILGAVILGLIAYGFLVLTIVFALAQWMDGSLVWLKIMAGATGVHLLLALLLILMARSRMKAGVFEQTKAELRKDRLWK